MVVQMDAFIVLHEFHHSATSRKQWRSISVLRADSDGLRAEHWIDKLEWAPGDGDQKNTCQLINVVKNENLRIIDWCLEIYGPEYTCVPYSDSQLYIFNAYDHTGVVYDIRDPGQSKVVQALPRQYTLNREHMLNSLYPILFTVEPRFSIKV
jgi:hypothetical protein